MKRAVPILFGPGFALRQNILMRYNIYPSYRNICPVERYVRRVSAAQTSAAIAIWIERKTD
jgi:hypothetical protein